MHAGASQEYLLELAVVRVHCRAQLRTEGSHDRARRSLRHHRGVDALVRPVRGPRRLCLLIRGEAGAGLTQCGTAVLASQPRQQLVLSLGVRARRRTGGDDGVTDRHSTCGTLRLGSQAPLEGRALGHVRQVVGTGLEQSNLALQELIAAEVAVIVRIGRRGGHVLLVDEVHQVADRGVALGARERKVPALVLQGGAGRAQVRNEHGLAIQRGVVSVLDDVVRVEGGVSRVAARRVQRQLAGDLPQRVGGGARVPRQVLQVLDAHAGRIQQRLVVVHRDRRVSEDRDAVELSVNRVLINGTLKPAVALGGGELLVNVDDLAAAGVLGVVVRVGPEDVRSGARGELRTQAREVVRPRDDLDVDRDPRFLGERGERRLVRLGSLIIPQTQGQGRARLARRAATLRAGGHQHRRGTNQSGSGNKTPFHEDLQL